MTHTLGVKRAYLDIPLEEAKRRFCSAEDTFGQITTFDFDDEFGVYDAWAP